MHSGFNSALPRTIYLLIYLFILYLLNLFKFKYNNIFSYFVDSDIEKKNLSYPLRITGFSSDCIVIQTIVFLYLLSLTYYIFNSCF